MSDNIDKELDEIALHISNSKAYKFYIETGKHLRDSIRVEYLRKARKQLDELIHSFNKRAEEVIVNLNKALDNFWNDEHATKHSQKHEKAITQAQQDCLKFLNGLASLKEGEDQ